MPVYSDEIVWRFHERAAIDGGFDVWLNDICGPATIARAPWFMLPARWFSATVNLALPSPLYVRLEGIACALLWIALFLELSRRIYPVAQVRHHSRTLMFSLLGLGVLPLLMVLSRPEQPILLAVTAMIVVALPSSETKVQSSGDAAWLRSWAILILATVALSYHVKGVAYAPVAGACILVCARGRQTVAARTFGLLALGALTSVATIYWSARFSCPDDLILRERLSQQNVAVLLSAKEKIVPLLPSMVRNAFPWSYLSQTIPSPEPLSQWLPTHIFSATSSRVYSRAIRLSWYLATLMGGIGLFQHLRKWGWKALSEPRACIAVMIMAVLMVWGLSQAGKNMYESALALPMFAIAILLSHSLAPPHVHYHRAVGGLATLTLAVSLVSQVMVIVTLSPPHWAAALRGGSVRGQPLSIAAFGYSKVRRDIIQAARAAGMTETRLFRPVVDDLTYMSLQRSYLPIHRLGLFGWWSGTVESDPIGYLLSRKSSGLIVGCEGLPEKMRGVSHRAGEICAISRTALDRLNEAKKEGRIFKLE